MTQVVTRRRSLAGPWVLLTLLIATACKEDDQSQRTKEDDPGLADGPTSAEAKVALAPGPTQSVPADSSCRDWSNLDLSSLPPLSPTPYTATFEAVWSTVLEKHYDPTLGCNDWPDLRRLYGEKLTEAASPTEAAAVMNDLLARLDQSHFRVVPPGATVERQRHGPAQVPLVARWLDGRVVVTDSTTRLVPPGSVLVGVDEESVDDIVAVARREAHQPEELPFRVRQWMQAVLSCESGKRRKVRFLHPDRADAEVERTIPCEMPPGERMTLGNLRDVPSRVEHRTISAAGGKVGYLAFNVWMLPLVKQVESAIEEFRSQEIASLILDLRGNPGGVGPMAVPVARIFLAKDGSLGTMKFREFTNEFKVEANPAAFREPVVVLVDEGTASTSEIFAAGMRDMGRVTIIGGQRSAGAALPSLIEELPGGAVLQFVVGDYHSPNGAPVEGHGVLPDVLVEEKRADFTAGRDPVLQAAVDYLNTT